ncbi:NHL repeat-containing protein [Pyxidicoccus xibeiensis]|uniref:hypothetical protein n=1 Tax=Pyxidicoccus xibeiensis TaxID=2906759 RepID=UPI0020A7758D|nr:hypothetical protein [Pyxidicoccus xibeiensis]MCP3139380.1 hypothetical protein [Pyxidicoccus xibeiensis]
MRPERRGGRGNRWVGLLPVAALWWGGCGGGAAASSGQDEQPVDEAAPSLPGTGGSGGGTQAPPPASPGPVPPERPVPPRAPAWGRVLGGPQDDSGTGVAVGRGGDVVLVVSSTPRADEDREPVEGEKLALTLSRYAPDGTLRWAREFVRNRLSDTRVAASPGGDGAVFLTGNAFLYSADFGLGEAQDGFLVKFSDDGKAVWQQRVGQKVLGVAADAAGGVLAAGEEWAAEVHDPVLTRYGADGTVRWTRRFEGTGEGTALSAVAVTPSGLAVLAGQLSDTVTVDGQAFGTQGVRGFGVLAFGEDGRLAWGKEVPGAKGRVTSVAVGADGAVVVAGDFTGLMVWGQASLGSAGPFVFAVGADGSERWLKQPACGEVTALGPAVTVDGEGTVAVACGDVLTRYGADGAWRDEQRLPVTPCPSGQCSLAAAGMAAVPGRGLAVTGWQRDGAGEAWNQDALLRLVVP